jgi:hypothetical protein
MTSTCEIWRNLKRQQKIFQTKEKAGGRSPTKFFAKTHAARQVVRRVGGISRPHLSNMGLILFFLFFNRSPAINRPTSNRPITTNLSHLF